MLSSSLENNGNLKKHTKNKRNLTTTLKSSSK